MNTLRKRSLAKLCLCCRSAVVYLALENKGEVVHRSCLPAAELDCFCGSFVKTIERVDFETRCSDKPVNLPISAAKAGADCENLLFGFLLFRSLESHNKRYSEVELLGGLDDTFGDVVAAHDTWKINQPLLQATHALHEPPNTFNKMDVTPLSLRRISKAFLTVSGVAPLERTHWFKLSTIRALEEHLPSDVEEVSGIT